MTDQEILRGWSRTVWPQGPVEVIEVAAVEVAWQQTLMSPNGHFYRRAATTAGTMLLLPLPRTVGGGALSLN